MSGSKPTGLVRTKNKAPVVCLHGFPGLPSHWDDLAALMLDDREVFSVPMPWLLGCPNPSDGFASMVQFVALLLRQTLTEPAHFVGHDLGGVALYWLARSGFRSAIKSATLISAPHPDTYRSFQASSEYAPRTRYIDAILATEDAATLRQELLGFVHGTDIQIAAQIEAALLATDFSALRTLYMQIKHAPAAPLPGELCGLGCPVALIHARDDWFFPAWVMDQSAPNFGPDTSTLCLPGSSHYPHLTTGTPVAAFMEKFWNDVETR